MPENSGQLIGLKVRTDGLRSAFSYGKDSLDQSQRPQTRYGEKVRRASGGAESEERLRWFDATASRCESDPGRESLPGQWPSPRLYSPVQGFAADFSRAGIARADPWRNKVELVSSGCNGSRVGPPSGATSAIA